MDCSCHSLFSVCSAHSVGIDQKLAIYEQAEGSLITQTEKHRFLT